MVLATTIHFGLVDVERRVRALAAEQPDRVTDCQYTRGDHVSGRRAHCLFAHALVELGVPLRWLVDLDAGDGGTAIDTVLVTLGVITDRADAAWCVHVQEMQDIGASWSAAVWAADREGHRR